MAHRRPSEHGDGEPRDRRTFHRFSAFGGLVSKNCSVSMIPRLVRGSLNSWRQQLPSNYVSINISSFPRRVRSISISLHTYVRICTRIHIFRCTQTWRPATTLCRTTLLLIPTRSVGRVYLYVRKCTWHWAHSRCTRDTSRIGITYVPSTRFRWLAFCGSDLTIPKWIVAPTLHRTDERIFVIFRRPSASMEYVANYERLLSESADSVWDIVFAIVDCAIRFARSLACL